MTPHYLIKIETANAAFKDYPAEVSRILRDIATQLENKQKGEHINVNDINDNHVGFCRFVKD